MDLKWIEPHKAAIERKFGIERYPFQTLDNLQLLDELFAKAGLDSAATLGGGKLLDVRCGDGDFGFHMSQRGLEVDLIDFEETNQNKLVMARELSRRLAGTHSVISIDLDCGFAALDSFYNMAIAFGLLYHLKNPFLFLGDLAEMCSYAAISTRIVDSGNAPGAYLVDDQELGTDNTNYWLFNSEGLERLAIRCGWRLLSRVRFGDKKSADSGRHDAREALLLASKFSVLPGVRIRSGLHRTEYSSYRWTHPCFQLELAPGATQIELDYYLPSPWLEDHDLEVVCHGQALPCSKETGKDGCSLIAGLPDNARQLEIRIRHAGITSEDQRPLGVVLRFDVSNSPIRVR